MFYIVSTVSTYIMHCFCLILLIYSAELHLQKTKPKQPTYNQFSYSSAFYKYLKTLLKNLIADCVGVGVGYLNINTFLPS